MNGGTGSSLAKRKPEGDPNDSLSKLRREIPKSKTLKQLLEEGPFVRPLNEDVQDKTLVSPVTGWSLFSIFPGLSPSEPEEKKRIWPVVSFDVVYSLIEVYDYIPLLIKSLIEVCGNKPQTEVSNTICDLLKSLALCTEAHKTMKNAREVFSKNIPMNETVWKVNLDDDEQLAFDILADWFGDLKAALLFENSISSSSPMRLPSS